MAWQDRLKEWGNLQAVQQKVGEVCMIWAALDYQIDCITADLLDVAPIQATVIGADRDFSKKCTLVKRLITLGSPGEEWFDEMDDLLTELASKLSPLRNRFIHDMWSFNVENIARIERTVTTKRPQSRQPKTLVADQEFPISLDDMERFCMRGYEILSRLDQLRPALIPWLLRERERLSQTQ
jgi:hypothetical protein